MIKKEIMYIDMDGVVADLVQGCERHPLFDIKFKQDIGEMCDDPELRIFKNLPPMKDAIESVNKLAEKYDVYFLTTVPRLNPMGYVDKSDWIKKYFPQLFGKMIASKFKDLNTGAYLIDDRKVNGAEDFKGEFIHFGTEKFTDWKAIIKYLEV